MRLDTASTARVLADGKPRPKILFLTTKVDHPWQTHMHTAVLELLATELNRSGDCEAIVSPDFDWPRDERIFDGVRAVVYYSGSAGDLIVGQHGEAFAKLMAQGVGFTALHFSTGANKLADRYLEYLGGVWTYGPDKLATGPVDWRYLQPDSPITRALGPVRMTDEIYLRPALHPQARPLIEVMIKDRTDPVAWTFERPGGGRSFGTTLGHPWENWQNAQFRRFVLNGILWTAGRDPLPEKPTSAARQP